MEKLQLRLQIGSHQHANARFRIRMRDSQLRRRVTLGRAVTVPPVRQNSRKSRRFRHAFRFGSPR